MLMKYLLTTILLVVLSNCTTVIAQKIPFATSPMQSGSGFNPFPREISYQGLLTTSSGAPALSGSYTLQFDLFYAFSGGSSIWSEVHNGVSVQNGTFNVRLGSAISLPPVFYTILFLEVKATAGPGLLGEVIFSPRTQLTSAAYSLGPWESNGVNVGFQFGNVGIGTLTPSFKLHIVGNNPTLAIEESGGSNANIAFFRGGVPMWTISENLGLPSGNLAFVSNPMVAAVMQINPGGRVAIGPGPGLVTPLGRLSVTTGDRYAGYFATDSANSAAHAVHGIYQGIGAFDAVGVYGESTPQDFYGIGGYFLGGYRGVYGRVVASGLGSYTGVYGVVAGGSGTAYGVRGSAAGSGLNYGVHGTASGGTNNYAGYFSGRIAVSAPDSNSSVQLPDNAISAPEVLDEPGIATDQVNTFIVLTGNTVMEDLATITMTTPAAGYINVRGRGMAQLSGTTGSNYVNTQIDQVSGGSTLVGLNSQVGGAGFASTGIWLQEITSERTYYLSAGTYTFRLEGMPSGTGIGRAVSIFFPCITAVYYPTAYGPVTAIVSSDQEHLFEKVSSEMSPVAVDGTSLSSTQVRTVDLRELELRATRTRLAAERAQREFLEEQAKLEKPDEIH